MDSSVFCGSAAFIWSPILVHNWAYLQAGLAGVLIAARTLSGRSTVNSSCMTIPLSKATPALPFAPVRVQVHPSTQ